ncbi:MAG: peptidase S53, partial [Candidatus Eremiobacteraeota bacterium]|nr:peptidase S53 [Candidatus Eremiobacteraeota bacterium]
RHHVKGRSFLTGAALGALFLAPAALPAQAAALNFVGRPAPTQAVDFMVHLPVRNSAQLDQLVRIQSTPGSPQYHHFLTPAQFRRAFGATSDTVARATSALRTSGLAVTKVDSQFLHVRGTTAAVERAFATQLGVAREPRSGRTMLAAKSRVTVPAALATLGASVSGFGYHIQPQPQFSKIPANRYSPFGGYWFTDLKQAYDYPSYGVANGKGVTVATVGESDFSSDDANLYFAHEKLGAGGLAPAPTVDHVLLPGAAPFDPNSGISDEANLDVQQVGGSAPGAHVLGVSIGGPGEPFLQAYSYIDEYNVADIVSTSYGECELYYTAAYNGGTSYVDILKSYHDVFRQGNSEGITFIFSSGDNSGLGCFPTAYFGPGTGKVYQPIQGAGIWVDDPNVTGVGGTNLKTTYIPGGKDSKYISENEIGDRILTPLDFYGTGNAIVRALWGSGDGTSVIFGKPDYQNLVNTGYSSRRDPDVSMHMGGCPFYGPGVVVECSPDRDSYDIAAIGGQFYGLIGTSASAPEFAGLLAVKESVTGSRAGNENYDLYTLASHNATGKYFHQGIPSFNGVVYLPAGRLGYNPILGVGTPYGRNFVGLPTVQAAGEPQTATNP